MPRTMYDGVNAWASPPGGDLYAGYADGNYPSYQDFVSLYPGKKVLSITVNGSTPGADMADFEPQNLGYPDTTQLIQYCRNHPGVPGVYVNQSDIPWVQQALANAGVTQVNWFYANYNGIPAILPNTAGHQYNGNIPPGYDVTALADNIPGIDVPTDWFDMASVTDLETALRAVLNEGTAFGEPGWAKQIADDHKTLSALITSQNTEIAQLKTILTELQSAGLKPAGTQKVVLSGTVTAA